MIAFGRLDSNNLSSIQLYKLKTSYDQFELFKKIQRHFKNVFILESLIGPKELSEMSVIGFDPAYVVTCNSSRFEIRDRKGDVKSEPVVDPLRQLSRLLPHVEDQRFRFIGGAVGYISYDAIRFWERLPSRRRNRGFPLLQFGLYGDGILFNHIENQAYYFSTAEPRLKEVQANIGDVEREPQEYRLWHSKPKRSMGRSEFIRKVKKAKKYIYDGDVFQVVLAKRIDFRIKGPLLPIYQRLREVNPSPYMYFLSLSGNNVIGSSPEMLVRVTGDHLETFPIAGTRPIGKNKSETASLAKQLLKDEKEVAEHTMLVDLARNDIGRVCEYGSVRVKDLMSIKQFSHVQHIVTHVEGKLQNNKDSFDAIRAVFPAGTVTGAPKVRAMEIIDELEPISRGPYAGALGYFSLNGCADFAITIRSLYVRNKIAYIQSGAGIVMDSDPENEWDETEFKAGAVLEALNRASS